MKMSIDNFVGEFLEFTLFSNGSLKSPIYLSYTEAVKSDHWAVLKYRLQQVTELNGNLPKGLRRVSFMLLFPGFFFSELGPIPEHVAKDLLAGRMSIGKIGNGYNYSLKGLDVLPDGHVYLSPYDVKTSADS